MNGGYTRKKARIVNQHYPRPHTHGRWSCAPGGPLWPPLPTRAARGGSHRMSARRAWPGRHKGGKEGGLDGPICVIKKPDLC